MLRTKIKIVLKSNKWMYRIYFFVMNTLLQIFGLFYLKKKKIILFSSFAGKGFSDSPKAIYNYLKDNNLLSDYQLVWAFENPEKYTFINNTVKIDTFKYFKIAVSAKIWITNSSIERGLKFKPKHTYCLNTWHGTPLKKMGIDIGESNESFRGKGNVTADSFCVQGEYESEIFTRVFELGDNIVINSGLPRNDVLTKPVESSDINKLKKKIGIPKDRFIVLYAPTFREYDLVEGRPGFMQKNIISEIANMLPEDSILLVRAHYEVANQFKESGINNNFINVSDYDDINDLYVVADCLVSDYSSVFFDYSITKKPMVVFQYDYKKYTEERGLYFDIRKELDSADSIEDLIGKIDMIKDDKALASTRSEEFMKKYINYSGEATKKCTKLLVKELEK
ncbi:CDP-glycerol glycerophosphotransferase family protein [Latilactobacillus sakei]|uniref:CDP-glycerol glycerophosphotransferase family protein n=1 Tax=Latilactobacillus sakei TaxID=1599 RepID=UPI003F532171